MNLETKENLTFLSWLVFEFRLVFQNNEKSVVELVKTIESSKNTTEFLMLTL